MELVNLWVEIINEVHPEMHVWSNHYENISHPFKTFDDLVYFDDDPNEKLMRHFKGGLNQLFEALCQTDFSNGSFVYGKSNCSVSSQAIRC